jgi:parallel beta-helix repeat protein/predicted outer membrane repeat protein
MRSLPFWVLVLVSFSLAQPARAETATAVEMETVCQNWLSLIVHTDGGWAGAAVPTIRSVSDIVSTDPALASGGRGRLLGRCYSIAPRGHVVVSVLKNMAPVKIYSDESDLDVVSGNRPAELVREILESNARAFIETYGDLDVSVARGDERLVDSRHRADWDQLLLDPASFASRLREEEPLREGVGPLLATSWHQGGPYNNLCPMGDGGLCVVGCVATAAAQVLNYHQWPPRGISGFSYYWDGDQSCGGNVGGTWLTADFDDTYDWANMPLNCNGGCSAAQQAATAELCYEVGVAYSMDYGACGSGAYTNEAVTIFPTYFRYDPSINEEARNAHSASSWFAIIQDEINHNRPMLYSFRYSASEGHAIVCDGWRIQTGQNQYHMNYGWGGSYNAWYTIDNIYHTYSVMEERMIRRIMPGTGFVFHVQPDGLGAYPTIQAAIDDVLAGDIVELADGTYTGTGNRDLNFHGKAITLRSQSGDPSRSIIDCEGGGGVDHRGLIFTSGEGAGAIVEGITIKNGAATGLNRGGAILCSNLSTPTIRNCVIQGCSSASGGGAIYCVGASPAISGCVFAGNTTSGSGGAFYLCGGANPSITNCTLYGNGALEGGGVWVCSGVHALFDNTIITGGLGGGAVGCDAGDTSATLHCCDVFGNTGGDWAGCIAGQFGIDGNISADPLFCATDNFHLQAESPCRAEQNPACGLIGALPPGCGSVLVSPDGTGDYPTIQAAIDAVLDGYVIELTDGVFTGAGNCDMDFHGKEITLKSQGGNPLSCIIDCQGGPQQQRRAFTFHSGEGPGAVLRGVTIQNGYLQIYSGGAIWISEGSMPTIEDCIFRDNQTQASGGAIWSSADAHPTFVRCTFHHNSTVGNGGAIFANSSAVSLINCTFCENAAGLDGGSVYISRATCSADNSIFTFATNGGSVGGFSSAIALQCCDIYGNVDGDWVGAIAGQLGQNGNISLDPMFCSRPSANYRLTTESPCAPYAPPSGVCDLIGAWPVDCNLTGIDDTAGAGMSKLMLGVVPNPFRGMTTLGYFVPNGSIAAGKTAGTGVRLAIFDAAGRVVRTLVDATRMAGFHQERWNGRNQAGSPVASGIYFCKLWVGGEMRTERVVLIR